MPDSNLCYAPFHQLANDIRAGTLTPSTLVEQYLARIEQHNGKLHALVDVYAAQARQAARAATEMIAAGQYLGPLHGIPLAVKDIIEWQDRITTGGSSAWRERRSTLTASVLQRLLECGMIIIGKTHSVEFAYGGWGTNEHMGMPWNPWDLAVRRTPGGSSSGSGVATAAGLTAAALGTDTGGSVRLPAGFCGTVGLKTTAGLIPIDGILPLAKSLDTVGPLTRSVEDAALLFNAMRGVNPVGNGDNLDPMPSLHAGVSRLRLGVLPESERSAVDPEILNNFDAAIKVLEKLGAVLCDITLPRPLSGYRDATAVLISAEGYSEWHDEVHDSARPMDRYVRERLAIGEHISSRDYLLAMRDRDRARQEMAATMSGIDAFMTPTTLTTAVAAEEVNEHVSPGHFTRTGNLLGWCGLSVPNGVSTTGLPTGLLINAAGLAEPLALQIGRAFEAATPELRRSPPGLE